MLPLCFEGLRHCDLASSYVFWYWSEAATPSGRAVTTCSSQTTTFWLNVTQKPKSCPNSDESCGNCNFGPLQKSSVERHSIVTRRGFRTGGLPCISSIHPAPFFLRPTPICFNPLCQFIPFLNLHPHIFRFNALWQAASF